MNLTRM